MRIVAFGRTALLRAGIAGLLAAMPAVATMGPWETAVTNLQTTFTGPIATGLSLIAVIVGGLMFAFGEGGSKRALAGIIFGIGMAVSAQNFINWLF
ncbi:MAG: TrbC/VirB2 family protein [Bryobacterales bacterium]|nr:TrbC/VirB2 family protein [Bryobacterales bacterium]